MSKSKSPLPAMTRKQTSRVERERRMRRYILGATIGVAVLVLGVIGYGLFDQFVLQPRQAVARVNGVPIMLGDFQKMVRYQRLQIIQQQYYPLLQLAQIFATDAQTQQYYVDQLQQVASYLADSATLGNQTLERMIEDELIRQEAARRGLSVSEAEIDALLEESFGFFPNGTPTPTVTPTDLPEDVPPTVNPTVVAAWTPAPTLTPTATRPPTATPTAGPSPTPSPTRTPLPTSTPFTADAYATSVISYYKDLGSNVGISQADLRGYVRNQILREKLQTLISADVPAAQEQVRARHILVEDLQTAQLVYELATQGREWAELAGEFSMDSSNASEGGYLGWFGRGQMVTEFETAAFDTPVGQISQPVQTSFGYHIIQVLEKGDRPLTASQLESARQQAFSDWLQAQRDQKDASGQPVVETYDNWRDKVPTEPALPG